ncbi:MAG: methyl-accepting chemotaxis protein [Desulfobacterales bacterium]|nr:methyl-accepting chemotaxis protein [Desulfobacterales bacterium]
MESVSKVFLSITLRTELYVFVIIAPFTAYFLSVAGQFSYENSRYLMIGIIAAAFSTLAFHMAARYIVLKKLFRSFADPDCDLLALKKRFINYPFYESVMVIFRWLLAIIICDSVFIPFVEELTTVNILALVVFPFFSMPFTSVLAYFVTENAMVPYLSNPRLSNPSLKKTSVVMFSENLRKLLMIASSSLIPFLMLGFFFFLSNNYGVHFNRIGLHFSFIIFLTLLSILATVHESARSTRKNIGNLELTMSKIKNGDLTAESVPMLSNSELGFLAQDLNSLLDRLSQFAVSVQKASEQVAGGGEQINASAEYISEGTSNQAASVEEISSSMEEMSSTVNLNADNAQQTSSIAKHAAHNAQEGKKAVNKTVRAMNVISAKIGIIEDIARETKMLALNAAIEAARAGEFGKGFAVVASEIRKLSDRCQKAAKTVSDLSVSNIQIAEETGRRLEEMVSGIQKTADLVEEISSSCNEQADGITQVNSAIQQLDEVIQQNVALTEEMAANSQHFAEQSEKLLKTASFFKISETAKQNYDKQSEKIPGSKKQKIRELFEKFIETQKQNYPEILNNEEDLADITDEKEYISINMEDATDNDFESY